MSARIHRVGRCYGLVLWRRPHLELWFCWEGVAEHRHPGQSVEVIPLFGWARFYRRSYPDGATAPDTGVVQIGPKNWGRAFTVPAGWPHWFTLVRAPLLFLNRTDDGRSAAENLQPTR